MPSTQRRPRSAFRIASVASLTLLAACGGGGGGDSSGPGGTPQPIQLASLSGVVVRPGGSGIEGATVRLGNLVVETNADGAFVMGFPEALPSKNVVLTVDGEPAELVGESFGTERYGFTVSATDERPTVPSTIVLPDRNSPDGDSATLTINGSGQVQNGTILNGGGDLSLVIAAGTVVSIAGKAAPTGLEVSMVRVDGEELGHPLPSSIAAAGFAAIGPTEARFNPVGGLSGLSAVLPNEMGFPLGTVVDIWAWDGDSLAWVNRTAQTGQSGLVISVPGGGTGIQAIGVVVEGGIYAGGLIANNGFSTTISGRLLNTDAQPIRDATVALATGQSGLTDEDGRYKITGVPAFNFTAALGSIPTPVPVAVGYRISTAAEDGALVLPKASVPAIGITPGGTTNVGDTTFSIPKVGALVGVLTGEQEIPGTPVTLVGPTGSEFITVGESNQYFLLNLEPGFYTSSTVFAAGGNPVYASAVVTEGQTSAVTLSPEGGTGSQNVSVFVGIEDGASTTPLVPAPGAQVLLFGTDAGSEQGVLRTTDAFGLASFQGVDGPFVVSAESTAIVSGASRRLTTTAYAITPPGGSITLALDGVTQPVVNATLQGTLSDLPSLAAGQSLELLAVARGDVAGERWVASTPIDPVSGAYSIAVPPSQALDLALVTCDSAIAGADSDLAQIVALPTHPNPVSAGGIGTFDASFNDGPAIAFDQLVDLDLSGGPTKASTASVALDLTLPGATGVNDTVRLPVVLGELNANGGVLALPSIDPLVLAGYGLVLRVTEEGFDEERSVASTPLTAATGGIELTFDQPPLVDDPFDGATFTASDLAVAALDVDVSESSGALVRLRLAASGAPIALGIDESVWTIWAPANDIPAYLPTLPMPMWVSGSQVTLQASVLRSEDSPLNLGQFAAKAPILAGLDLSKSETLASGRSAVSTITVDGE
ncbi:carboxypeptidase-like regulatory domain-containing protein [Engelhardtia mirabilis]|uniref:Carboxypeptidase regulatory-like domain-containing protein n=1 Tax=Engelhardtia mirabilis TaxID=2528011 RepID=A0A518BS35_9BACT|nr:hypothetical protein Pla133_49030 [Planctomycetes bacterium Pla133]QDV04107.1 hypothetical protein Pla86_49010 [Planctomycetes bacterium Pla86]